MEIKVGTKGRVDSIVTEERTAAQVGSGSLPVYATPMMVALIEEAAWKSVQDQLEDGQGSVGIQMDVAHLSATPLGMKVWAETEVTAVDGRKLTFAVKAFDEAGLIGEGVHQRFVIDNEKFLGKCQKKLGK